MGISLSVYALCTVEEVKAYLNLSETSGDEQLTSLVNNVSLAAQNTYMQRTLLSAEATEYYSGNGVSRMLVLKRYPVISISSFVAYEGGDELVEGDDYELDAEAGTIELKHSAFPKTVKEIAITYTAGYAAGADNVADVPGDLRQSVIEAVALKKGRRTHKSVGLRAQSKGDSSREYDTRSFPPEIVEVWKRYRRKA